MSEEWLDTPEDDGITLGPEEALEREIAKSKALKVERLQLKDQVERLTDQNRSLRNQLEDLKQKQEGPLSRVQSFTRYPLFWLSTAHESFSAESLGVFFCSCSI